MKSKVLVGRKEGRKEGLDGRALNSMNDMREEH